MIKYLIIPLLFLSSLVYGQQGRYPFYKKVATVAPAGTTLNTGLVAQWNFNESSGNLIDNVNAYDGTLQNTPTVSQTGKLGNCYSFDYSSQEIVLIGNGIMAPIATSDFSIFSWIFNTDGAAMGIFGTNDGVDDIYFQVFKAYTGNWTAVINFNFGDNTIEYTTPLSENAWHLIGITVDRQGYIRMYIDGTERGTAVNISSRSSVSLDDGDSFIIGALGTYTGYFWNDRIDDTAVWSRSLSAADVTEYWNSGNGKTHPF